MIILDLKYPINARIKPKTITPIITYIPVLSFSPSIPETMLHNPTIVKIAEIPPNKPNKLKDAGIGVPTLDGCSAIAEPSPSGP